MKRKTLAIISSIVIVAYLPFAPIFLMSEYGTQKHASLPVAQSYSYLWIERDDSLLYLGLCGFWNYRMQERAHLLFHDEQGKLSKVVIGDVHILIDGLYYQVSGLKNKLIKMDAGPSNGYAGEGASGSLSFSLPVVPKTSAQIDIEGDAIDIHGRRVPFSISVRSDVISESSIIPLFKYFYSKFTET